jgi:hypothetical protein
MINLWKDANRMEFCLKLRIDQVDAVTPGGGLLRLLTGVRDLSMLSKLLLICFSTDIRKQHTWNKCLQL